MFSRWSEYEVTVAGRDSDAIHSDWFRLETLDDSLQPTIDMLLNLSVFMWFGAVCPWAMFLRNDVIPIYRLIFLGILVLLFRRVPIIFAMHRKIPQIEEKQQALFVGFFGPIGVSAVFYLYISLEFLNQITVDGSQRPDAAKLGEVMTVVIWFLAICSIVRLFMIKQAEVHGLRASRWSMVSVFPWESWGSIYLVRYRVLWTPAAPMSRNRFISGTGSSEGSKIIVNDTNRTSCNWDEDLLRVLRGPYFALDAR